MQDERMIRALYCVLTGQPYAEGSCLVLDHRDLWKSAELLFRFFEPTDAQIGALLLYKFGGDLPEQVAPEKQGQEEENREAPIQKKTGEGVPILAVGDISWIVNIDGIPLKCRLDYSQGHLPVKRAGLCLFQDKLYRVSKIYATTLDLTSQESELYSMNGQEVIR